MGIDRRAEWISGVLCVGLTTLCMPAEGELVRLALLALRDCGCELPAAAQFVIDLDELPFALRAVPWSLGVALVGLGFAARRHPRFDTVGLVALFFAPLIPVVMLAFSAIALLLPMLAMATSGSLNT